MFGFGKPKCAQCGMELNPEYQHYTWNDKKFCCKDCKKAYRRGKGKGGGKCH